MADKNEVEPTTLTRTVRVEQHTEDNHTAVISISYSPCDILAGTIQQDDREKGVVVSNAGISDFHQSLREKETKKNQENISSIYITGPQAGNQKKLSINFLDNLLAQSDTGAEDKLEEQADVAATTPSSTENMSQSTSAHEEDDNLPLQIGSSSLSNVPSAAADDNLDRPSSSTELESGDVPKIDCSEISANIELSDGPAIDVDENSDLTDRGFLADTYLAEVDDDDGGLDSSNFLKEVLKRTDSSSTSTSADTGITVILNSKYDPSNRLSTGSFGSNNTELDESNPFEPDCPPQRTQMNQSADQSTSAGQSSNQPFCQQLNMISECMVNEEANVYGDDLVNSTVQTEGYKQGLLPDNDDGDDSIFHENQTHVDLLIRKQDKEDFINEMHGHEKNLDICDTNAATDKQDYKNSETLPNSSTSGGEKISGLIQGEKKLEDKRKEDLNTYEENQIIDCEVLCSTLPLEHDSKVVDSLNQMIETCLESKETESTGVTEETNVQLDSADQFEAESISGKHDRQSDFVPRIEISDPGKFFEGAEYIDQKDLEGHQHHLTKCAKEREPADRYPEQNGQNNNVVVESNKTNGKNENSNNLSEDSDHNETDSMKENNENYIQRIDFKKYNSLSLESNLSSSNGISEDNPSDSVSNTNFKSNLSDISEELTQDSNHKMSEEFENVENTAEDVDLSNDKQTENSNQHFDDIQYCDIKDNVYSKERVVETNSYPHNNLTNIIQSVNGKCISDDDITKTVNENFDKEAYGYSNNVPLKHESLENLELIDSYNDEVEVTAEELTMLNELSEEKDTNERPTSQRRLFAKFFQFFGRKSNRTESKSRELSLHHDDVSEDGSDISELYLRKIKENDRNMSQQENSPFEELVHLCKSDDLLTRIAVCEDASEEDSSDMDDDVNSNWSKFQSLGNIPQPARNMVKKRGKVKSLGNLTRSLPRLQDASRTKRNRPPLAAPEIIEEDLKEEVNNDEDVLKNIPKVNDVTPFINKENSLRNGAKKISGFEQKVSFGGSSSQIRIGSTTVDAVCQDFEHECSRREVVCPASIFHLVLFLLTVSSLLVDLFFILECLNLVTTQEMYTERSLPSIPADSKEIDASTITGILSIIFLFLPGMFFSSENFLPSLSTGRTRLTRMLVRTLLAPIFPLILLTVRARALFKHQGFWRGKSLMISQTELCTRIHPQVLLILHLILCKGNLVLSLIHIIALVVHFLYLITCTWQTLLLVGIHFHQSIVLSSSTSNNFCCRQPSSSCRRNNTCCRQRNSFMQRRATVKGDSTTVSNVAKIPEIRILCDTSTSKAQDFDKPKPVDICFDQLKSADINSDHPKSAGIHIDQPKSADISGSEAKQTNPDEQMEEMEAKEVESMYLMETKRKAMRLESREVYHRSEEELSHLVREFWSLRSVLYSLMFIFLNSVFRLGAVVLIVLLLRLYSLLLVLLILTVYYLINLDRSRSPTKSVQRTLYSVFLVRGVDAANSPVPEIKRLWKTTLVCWFMLGIPCLTFYVLVSSDPYLMEHWQFLKFVQTFNIFMSYDLMILLCGLLSLPLLWLINVDVIRLNRDCIRSEEMQI